MVQMLYIVSFYFQGYIYYFLILLTGIILLPIGIYEFSRINAAKEFKPTNCTTISSNYTGKFHHS